MTYGELAALMPIVAVLMGGLLYAIDVFASREPVETKAPAGVDFNVSPLGDDELRHEVDAMIANYRADGLKEIQVTGVTGRGEIVRAVIRTEAKAQEA